MALIFYGLISLAIVLFIWVKQGRAAACERHTPLAGAVAWFLALVMLLSGLIFLGLGVAEWTAGF